LTHWTSTYRVYRRSTSRSPERLLRILQTRRRLCYRSSITVGRNSRTTVSLVLSFLCSRTLFNLADAKGYGAIYVATWYIPSICCILEGLYSHFPLHIFRTQGVRHWLAFDVCKDCLLGWDVFYGL